MNDTIKSIGNALGKPTRFVGFGVGMNLVHTGAMIDPTNWGQIVGGTVLCIVGLIWSVRHDKAIKGDE